MEVATCKLARNVVQLNALVHKTSSRTIHELSTFGQKCVCVCVCVYTCVVQLTGVP